jgi:hypothetical protein
MDFTLYYNLGLPAQGEWPDGPMEDDYLQAEREDDDSIYLRHWLQINETRAWIGTAA